MFPVFAFSTVFFTQGPCPETNTLLKQKKNTCTKLNLVCFNGTCSMFASYQVPNCWNYSAFLSISFVCVLIQTPAHFHSQRPDILMINGGLFKVKFGYFKDSNKSKLKKAVLQTIKTQSMFLATQTQMPTISATLMKQFRLNNHVL